MAKNDDDAPDELGNETKNYAKYTGVIFQMIAIIAIFAFAGHFLDNKFKTETPWITAISCIVGVCLSIYQIIRQLK